jgi:RNA polymerase-binding transcription factor DksA
MTRHKRRILQEQLLRERAQAERAIRAAAPADEVDRSTTDKADIATIAIEKGAGDLVISLESAAVKEIDAALAVLEEDPESYGRCEVCGKRIPGARLEVLPATRHCAAHSPNR